MCADVCNTLVSYLLTFLYYFFFKMNVSTNEKDDTEIKNFEKLKYKITDNNDILLDDSCDPDINLFNNKFQSFDTPYLMPEEFRNFHSNSMNQFSILH